MALQEAVREPLEEPHSQGTQRPRAKAPSHVTEAEGWVGGEPRALRSPQVHRPRS